MSFKNSIRVFFHFCNVHVVFSGLLQTSLRNSLRCSVYVCRRIVCGYGRHVPCRTNHQKRFFFSSGDLISCFFFLQIFFTLFCCQDAEEVFQILQQRPNHNVQSKIRRPQKTCFFNYNLVFLFDLQFAIFEFALSGCWGFWRGIPNFTTTIQCVIKNTPIILHWISFIFFRIARRFPSSVRPCSNC